MKLPLDQKYLKIALHAIIVIVCSYALIKLVDGIFFTFTNMGFAFSAIGNFFSRLTTVFSTLIIGLVVAYLLDPIVDFFQRLYDGTVKPKLMGITLYRKKVNKERLYKERLAGTSLTYLFIFSLILLGAFLLYKKLGVNGTSNLMDKISAVAARTANDFSERNFALQMNLYNWGLLDYASKYLTAFTQQLSGIVKDVGTSVVSGLSSAGNFFLKLVIGFVIAFYFLINKEASIKKSSNVMDFLIPRRINKPLKNFLSDVNSIFSGYIRGQLTDALIMAILISTWLSILKIDFAIIIGIFTGISNLIPYFGAIIGLILSITAALLTGEPMKAVYAAVGILILQQIDGIFIVPKVVGESVELSPVLVILSLAVASELFGITGMIFAVPVTAVIKLLIGKVYRNGRIRSSSKA